MSARFALWAVAHSHAGGVGPPVRRGTFRGGLGGGVWGPGGGRAAGGVAADGGAQRARPAVLRARGAAASAARRRERAAPGRRQVNISSVAGRAARNGNGVYSLTKHGAGAFSESLRQEVT